MPAGLQIFNTSGTILIDEHYHNLCVVKKATHTLTGTPLVTTFYTGTQVQNSVDTGLTLTNRAIVAVRCSSVVHAYVSGNNVVFVGAPGAVITYYVFDKPPASTATYGLVVYTATGEVAFDATRQYARVSGVRSGSTVAAWAGAVSYPAGRTYAVAFLRAARQYSTQCIQVGDPQFPEYDCYRSIKYSGASISGVDVTFAMTGVYHYEYFPTASQSAVVDSDAMVAAVIDVTAY